MVGLPTRDGSKYTVVSTEIRVLNKAAHFLVIPFPISHLSSTVCTVCTIVHAVAEYAARWRQSQGQCVVLRAILGSSPPPMSKARAPSGAKSRPMPLSTTEYRTATDSRQVLINGQRPRRHTNNAPTPDPWPQGAAVRAQASGALPGAGAPSVHHF